MSHESETLKREDLWPTGLLWTAFFLLQHERWGYFQQCISCLFFPVLQPFLHSASKIHQVLFIMGHNDLLFRLFPWSSPVQPSPLLLSAKADSSLLGGTFALSKSSISQFVQRWLERWKWSFKVPYYGSFRQFIRQELLPKDQVTSEDCWRLVYMYQIFSALPQTMGGQHTADTHICLFQRNRQGTKLKRENALVPKIDSVYLKIIKTLLK